MNHDDGDVDPHARGEAQRAYEAGQHNRALELVEARLAEVPGDGPARTLGIRCLLELGRPLEASSWIDQHLAARPDDPVVLALRARAALRTGRADVAEHTLAQLAEDPADAATARLRAELAFALADRGGALRWAVAALDAAPDEAEGWLLASVLAADPQVDLQPLVARLIDADHHRMAALGGLIEGSAEGSERLLDALWHLDRSRTAILAAMRFLGPRLPLEQALTWSARVRALGHADDCPVLGIAANTDRSAHERVRAACAAVRAFGDARGEPLLALAVSQLRTDELAETFAEALQLAPDLVETFVVAAASEGSRCMVMAAALATAGVGEFGVSLLRHALDSGASPAALAATSATVPAPARAQLADLARMVGEEQVLATLGA